MNLKSVEFYQSVRLWDNHEYKTVTEGKNRQLEGIELDLRDHIVTIYCPGKPRLILVPTANMRLAMIDQDASEVFSKAVTMLAMKEAIHKEITLPSIPVSKEDGPTIAGIKIITDENLKDDQAVSLEVKKPGLIITKVDEKEKSITVEPTPTTTTLGKNADASQSKYEQLKPKTPPKRIKGQG